MTELLASNAGEVCLNPMDAPKMTEAQKTAIRSLEKALALLRSVQTLEGTDKDGVEHLLGMALENLRADK
jgi:hypothetical protein